MAIGFAPGYHAQNQDAGRFGYPRIPLPATSDLLRASAKLGSRVAACLNASTHHQPQGATVTRFWSRIAPAILRDQSVERSLQAEDLGMTGWAVRQPAGIFPKDGETATRKPGDDERSARAQLSEELGLTLEAVNEALGVEVVDIMLNDSVMWSGIPSTVWDAKLGGYVVLRKWLSYRDGQVLGRKMTVPEVREFTDIVRRITDLRLAGSRLTDVYEKTLAAPYHW